MPTAPPLRIAAAQYPVAPVGSWAAYRDKLAAWVAEAAGAGATLLVFPEYGALELASLFPAEIHGDLARQLPALQELLPDFLNLHRHLADSHGVHILAATLPVRGADGRYRNRAHLVAPGGGIAWQDKLVLTRFERELWDLAPGEELRVIETAIGRIGISICYDIEFPLIARRQAEAGADLILAPSSTGLLAGWRRVRIGARARALENQCYVVQAPTVGTAPWSPVVDTSRGAAAVYCTPDPGFFPEDGILAEGELDRPQWVHAELDFDLLRRVRSDGKVVTVQDWPRQERQAAAPAVVVRT